jgi:hypothetical protein
VNLTDNTCLSSVHKDHPVWHIAIYTAHLACGQSVSCQAIKSGTITKCLLSVAKFVMRGITRDPRKWNQLGKGLATETQDVIDKVKRWEDVPDRREPFAVKMRRFLVQLLASQPHLYGPDSDLAAIRDFCGMGLCDGFGLSKWAQPNSHSELDNPQINRRGNVTAFCLRDVEFLTAGEVHVPTVHAITMDVKNPKVGRDFLTCHTQKNGDNSEMRQHAQNSGISGPCHVTCLMMVVQRFDRLVGNISNIPFCVLQADNGRVCCITDNVIVKWFRKAAAHACKLDPAKDSELLRKWLAHSLQVGATVILHRMGFSDAQIQFLLCWRSNAFDTCLRNAADKVQPLIDRHIQDHANYPPCLDFLVSRQKIKQEVQAAPSGAGRQKQSLRPRKLPSFVQNGGPPGFLSTQPSPAWLEVWSS